MNAVLSLLSMGAFWLSGMVRGASAILLGVAIHQYRHELRRRRYGLSAHGMEPFWFVVASFVLTDLLAPVCMFSWASGLVVAGGIAEQWLPAASWGEALTMLAINALAAIILIRATRFHREKARKTCPLCLGEDCLTSAPQGDSDGMPSGAIRCENPVSSRFEDQECGFAFPPFYLDVRKFCFPIVGIPGAGKTHWQAMIYHQLQFGVCPPGVEFSPVQSGMDREFDAIVSEILDKRMQPAATMAVRIPPGLLFCCRDNDRWGRSSVLMNIVDYTGEITRNDMSFVHRQIDRLAAGEGFFFFLDPTRSADDQERALAMLREDTYQRTRGNVSRGPVAICLSKIDLLTQLPDGRGCAEGFYESLSQIGWELNLESIAARSELTQELVSAIWPRWNLLRMIDEGLDGRVMLFPMTPIGFNADVEVDLGRVGASPVGILEPLLWLIHMNGYPVLK